MTAVPLKSLCQIRHGGTPSKANAAYWVGHIPWVSPKDMKSVILSDACDHISQEAVENSATSVIPEKSILVVVRSGILAHSLPVAQVAKPLAFNQDIKALTPDATKVDPDYLFWFIRAKEPQVLAQGVKKGATVHSLQSGFIENLQVPLPAREEQRRIVDLLSRAEGIVRLRREAEKKAAELIPALFLDMFGDPGRNPKGWPVRKVSDFVARFEGGKNIQAGSGNGSLYRILKVSAATSGIYRESESKPSPDGYNPPPSHIVRSGDMLFSRANTEEMVGATAIVEKTNGKTLLPDKLWRFVWAEPVEPTYMHAVFQSPHVRRELGQLSSGTSASMRNISQGKLFNLRLPIAPQPEQERFSQYAVAAKSILSQQSAATTTAQATFDALLAQAFSG
jgi:type I restriction enzyme S subunit